MQNQKALWNKLKNLKPLFGHRKELYASKETKENALGPLASEGNYC